MKTVTKHLILACAFAGLCGQSNAMKRNQPDSDVSKTSRTKGEKRPLSDNEREEWHDRNLHSFGWISPDWAEAAFQQGINTRDTKGHTVLMWDIQHQSHKNPSLKEMVAHIADGAFINAQDNDGNTALHWATHDGRTDKVIRKLLDAGADVNAQNEDGETPLMYAVRECSVAIIKLLLERGADVNTQNNYGETALMWAAGLAKDPAVRLLLSRNKAGDLLWETETLVRDNSGQTALEWAQQKGTHTCEMFSKVDCADRQAECIKLLKSQQKQERETIRENMEMAENDWIACPLDVLQDVIRPFIDPEHRDNNQ